MRKTSEKYQNISDVFSSQTGYTLPVVCFKVARKMPVEKSLVEWPIVRAIPDLRAGIQQLISMAIHCFDGEAEPVGDLLGGETIRDTAQDIELAMRNLLDKSLAARVFLRVHARFPGLLGRLRAGKRLRQQGNVIGYRKERHLDQVHPCIGRNVHLRAVSHLRLDSFGRVDVPDMVERVEFELRG